MLQWASRGEERKEVDGGILCVSDCTILALSALQPIFSFRLPDKQGCRCEAEQITCAETYECRY
jgi:hypothetical protein